MTNTEILDSITKLRQRLLSETERHFKEVGVDFSMDSFMLCHHSYVDFLVGEAHFAASDILPESELTTA